LVNHWSAVTQRLLYGVNYLIIVWILL
jgi:hypothetical protein